MDRTGPTTQTASHVEVLVARWTSGLPERDHRGSRAVHHDEIAFWALLGAIPHGIYFTPLRKHQAPRTQFVIWSSGIGTLAAILEIAVGVWMYSPRKRYLHAGEPSSVPY
jgi:prolipoprotein diacylglyceryltransferase